ncbi:MAG: hypothetical protein HY909_02090 [Deltaproteobacteria bacterium]|nr:hypothetical protein [Deltaproteobacteria bacterium]
MDPRRRERTARLLLAPLVLALLAAAAVAPWSAPFCVDNRTYLEMTEGVARHGLPYTLNGPVERMPELQARWNQRDGPRLWGSYLPGYPYLAAPLYLLGGARALTRANIALLAALALVVFALGRRVTGDPLSGTAAAYGALVGTHVWTFSHDVSPYSLVVTALTGSTLLALRALDEQGPGAHRYALCSGALAAIALAAHGLALPMGLATVALLGLLRRDGEAPLWPRGPSRGSLVRGAWALLPVALVLSAIAALNHQRFHDWNPLSTGACPWRSCASTYSDPQGSGMLSHNAPVLLWAAATAALGWLLRGSRRGLAVVLAGALLALAPPSLLRERALAVATLAVAFLVDLSRVELGLWRPPDGVGNYLGPWVVKSLLQSSPMVALALLVSPEGARERRAVSLLALPGALLVGTLVLRTNVTPLHALGYPFVNLRYLAPLLPPVVVLAVWALRAHPWGPRRVAAVALLALALGVWFARAESDLAPFRRMVVLRAPLALALAAFALGVRARLAPAGVLARVLAPAAAALAVSYALAVNTGVDLRAWVRERQSHQRRLEHVARATPSRFALLGWAGGNGIDAALSLRAERDIEYADIAEVERLENARRLVDHWSDQGRPVFVMLPPPVVSPWPDVTVEPVDAEYSLYRMRRR